MILPGPDISFRRLEIGTGQRTFLLEELDLNVHRWEFSGGALFWREGKLEVSMAGRNMMPNTLPLEVQPTFTKVAGL